MGRQRGVDGTTSKGIDPKDGTGAFFHLMGGVPHTIRSQDFLLDVDQVQGREQLFSSLRLSIVLSDETVGPGLLRRHVLGQGQVEWNIPMSILRHKAVGGVRATLRVFRGH